jgi:hypothetical protein
MTARGKTEAERQLEAAMAGEQRSSDAEQNYQELLPEAAEQAEQDEQDEQDEQVRIRPLLDRGMKAIDAFRLYTRCNEDIELAVLAYHLAVFAGNMARRCPNNVFYAPYKLNPLKLLSSLDLLRRTLDMLDRLLTAEAMSGPFAETDADGVRERMAIEATGLITWDRLPRMAGWGHGVLGDGVDDLIKHAEEDGRKAWAARKDKRYPPWQEVRKLEQHVEEVLRDAGIEYPSWEQVESEILRQISVQDLMRFEYYLMVFTRGYSCGPVRLWRRFFELRDEPVPEEREELLSEEQQVISRRRRKKLKQGEEL